SPPSPKATAGAAQAARATAATKAAESTTPEPAGAATRRGQAAQRAEGAEAQPRFASEGRRGDRGRHLAGRGCRGRRQVGFGDLGCCGRDVHRQRRPAHPDAIQSRWKVAREAEDTASLTLAKDIAGAPFGLHAGTVVESARA